MKSIALVVFSLFIAGCSTQPIKQDLVFTPCCELIIFDEVPIKTIVTHPLFTQAYEDYIRQLRGTIKLYESQAIECNKLHRKITDGY